MSQAESAAPPPLPERGPAQLDIGRCINDAMEVYKRNLWPLVFAAFLFEILIVIPPLILAGPLWGGIVFMCLDAMTGAERRVDFNKFFSGFGRFFPLLLLFLLTSFLMLLGFVLLIVPFVILMTIWMYPTFLMMDKGVPVFTALRMSKDAVLSSGFWPHLGLACLILLMALGPACIPYIGVVIAWFVAPIAWLMNTSAYVQVVREGRAAQSDDATAARCGQCGYEMRGVSTFYCPECGADLREVGMIPA